MWEKDKLLVTSNFSISHSVFKRLIFHGCQKVSLCGNGLRAQQQQKVNNGRLTMHFDLILSQTANSRLFKLNKLADNFNFDKNGRKLSKQVEKNVGKGKIARYEQFLLFLQCFQKTCTVDM